ncbi:MAG: (d)CMP kinase [Syntrophobacterales bacterium]|jgi:cytidylate kinase|nr:(d)CMP kinase [Syntrophobacterales bacterium]
MADGKSKDLIITIDGPSGSGKSTVAKMLAKTLGYTYIDTGAMYRGVAYAYMKAGEPTDLKVFLDDLPLRFEFGDGTKVSLNNIDISREIREPGVSLSASSLSKDRVVREYLWHIQNKLGRKGSVVLEGRDMGSVVFPDAHIKFYLDANLSERARRRYHELSSKGMEQDSGSVETEMVKRDRSDSERDIAPLVVPDGAILIDSTGINAEQVVSLMIDRIPGAGA